MITATIRRGTDYLSSLISQLKPGEEVVIMEQNRPVARLVAERRSPANGS